MFVQGRGCGGVEELMRGGVMLELCEVGVRYVG
jgi:hypothetical protein